MTTATITRPADCIAPKTNLAGYKLHGCRCAGCTKASSDYNNRRDRLIAYGRWQPMVDAEPVRQHIRDLMAAKIGWQRVAQAAGISSGGVSRILYGSHGRGPCKKVQKTTADAILSVQPRAELRSVDSSIDATGTRRRTQALAVLGWSISEQAARLGRTFRSHHYVLTADRVTIRTAQMVEKLYDQLSTQIPEPSYSVNRTKRRAQRNGWVPPLGWDEGAIDDPNAEPCLGDSTAERDTYDPITVAFAVDGRLTHDQIKGNRADLIETVRRLAPRMSDQQIATHLRWPGAEDGPPGKTRGQGAVCQLRTRNGIPNHHAREVIAPTSTRDRARAARRLTKAA